MTRPDPRLRRLLPVERWPSREEAAASRWFSPVRIGSLEATSRTWVPAMVPWRASSDGVCTRDVVDWYRRFAEGRPGVIVVEATGIRDVPSGPLLRIGHDRYVEGLTRLVQAVREASGGATRVFIQLIDFLAIKRRPDPARFLREFLVIDPPLRERLASLLNDRSSLAFSELEVRAALLRLEEPQLREVLSPRDFESYSVGYRERVTDTHLPHIASLPAVLPQLFAEAAARAQRAGFDGVELHYAHAYTMASFLSARNTRADGYGGLREGRVRLPLEVMAAVRARVGAAYVVGLRFLGDEVIEGGTGIDDATYFGVELARAGADFLSLSKGGKFEDAKQPKIGQAAYPYTGESGHECMPTVHIGPPGPFGRNVSLAREVRAAVRAAGMETPIVAAGGIASFWQAEEILARGDADIVAAARQTLADPDWFEKIRVGHGAEVRRCLFTNYCEALDQAHKEVTCQRWDREDLEHAATRSRDGKRRLVSPSWSPTKNPA